MVGLSKSQSMVEYALLAVVIIAALGGGMIYLKKANQARIKKATDSLGKQFSYTNSNFAKSTYFYSSVRSELQFNGESEASLLEPEVTKQDYQDNFSGVGLKEEDLWE
jgi:uncharacterized protein (UPF0333 family)